MTRSTLTTNAASNLTLYAKVEMGGQVHTITDLQHTTITLATGWRGRLLALRWRFVLALLLLRVTVRDAVGYVRWIWRRP